MKKYPDLTKAKMISLDIETYDPLLIEKGPGVYRRDGNILGVALATPDGFSNYYNVGHKGVSASERDNNLAFLKDTLVSDVPKLGANLSYDLDWLENWAGISVGGELHDVLIAEPLLNEHRLRYNLDVIAKDYLGEGKKKDKLEAFCKNNNLKGDARKWLYLMDADIVGEYAIEDVRKPLEIFIIQWQKMKEEGLLDVYHIEIGLIRLLLKMRKVGARIDVDHVNRATAFLKTSLEEREQKLFSEYGDFSYRSTKQLAAIFDSIGLPYETTAKGNPSITAPFLASLDHPIAKQITDAKRFSDTLSTFFHGSLIGARVGDRIHTTFNQLRAGEKGTVSGRFSSSTPNLQNIPSRHKVIGPLCRRAFIPEDGCYWGRIDWSQIEFRVLAHYAYGEGSEEVRKAYNEKPDTDYHDFVMQLTGLERKPAKNLNFGAVYFMGVNKCAKTYGWSKETAKALLDIYHTKLPFVRATGMRVADVARSRGYIKTISGRRSRVSEYITKFKKYYIMFNHLIQGTAADVMKIAMKEAYDSGLFDILTPHLTVHDELGLSVPKTKEGESAYRELKHVMESCVSLKVPILAVAEYGENWHDVKEFKGVFDETRD